MKYSYLIIETKRDDYSFVYNDSPIGATSYRPVCSEAECGVLVLKLNRALAGFLPFCENHDKVLLSENQLIKQ